MIIDLDQSLTDAVLGQMVGISPQAVGEFARGGVIPASSAPVRARLLAYCARLRSQAAGTVTLDGTSLVHERALTERVDRQLKEVQLAERLGLLVSVEQIEPEYEQMVSAFRIELQARDDKLVTELQDRYGIDVDPELLARHTRAALAQLSRHNPGGAADDAPAGEFAQTGGAADDDAMGAEVPAALS